jgi:hypothetical protein
MSPGPAASLHANPEWLCGYCGRREAMPADAAERHRYLRLRLLQLQRAREASEAPLQSFRALSQTYPLALALFGVMALWQGYNFWNGAGVSGSADIGQLLFALLPLAVALGMLSGWLGMRRAFAAQLRPLLRARPPRQQGLAARCRGCGADLPLVRAPEVKCTYCSASNVLDAALTTSAGVLLTAEADEYRRRAQGFTHDPNVYLAPSRAFYRFGAIGAVATLAIGLALFGVLR